MNICISSINDDVKSPMDQRFGRCSYFAIYDDKSDKLEFMENNNQVANHGAGVATAQSIVDRGVKVLITGNIGPNAMDLLKASGVEVYQGIGNNLEEIIKNFKEGKLTKLDKAVKAHYGLGRGARHGRRRV